MAKENPSPEDMLKSFFSMISSSIDADGMSLTQYYYWDKESGGASFAVNDVPLNEPGNPFWHIQNLVDADKTDYLLMAMDMNSAPDQDLEFSDFILVAEFDRRRPEPFLTSQWRYGVINYDKSATPPVIRDIDWLNRIWKDQGAWYMKRFGPPFRVKVKHS